MPYFTPLPRAAGSAAAAACCCCYAACCGMRAACARAARAAASAAQSRNPGIPNPESRIAGGFCFCQFPGFSASFASEEEDRPRDPDSTTRGGGLRNHLIHAVAHPRKKHKVSKHKAESVKQEPFVFSF